MRIHQSSFVDFDVWFPLFRYFEMTEHILLVGSGGREHALAWALSKSPSVSKVFVSPGNAGTASGEKVSNIGKKNFL